MHDSDCNHEYRDLLRLGGPEALSFARELAGMSSRDAPIDWKAWRAMRPKPGDAETLRKAAALSPACAARLLFEAGEMEREADLHDRAEDAIPHRDQRAVRPVVRTARILHGWVLGCTGKPLHAAVAALLCEAYGPDAADYADVAAWCREN